MATYEISYLIEGDPIASKINVPITADADGLRYLIYQHRGLLRDARVGDQVTGLTLFRVQYNLATLTVRNLSELTQNNFFPDIITLFDPTRPISEIWENPPPARHLHVFVQIRDGHQVETAVTALSSPSERHHIKSISAAIAALSPSSVAGNVSKYKHEQDAHPIYNGRPIERRGPPVMIYDRSLAILRHNLHNVENIPEPSSYIINLTAEFFHIAAKIFDSENRRGEMIYGHLERLLGTKILLSVRASGSKMVTEADAMITGAIQHEFFSAPAVVAYIELKNELGIRGDGGLQATLSLRKYITQPDYRDILKVSCCPCVIISIAGPYLQIAGAVFVEVFSTQIFTSYIHMGPFETKQVYYVAKVFTAVAQAVKSLQETAYYLLPRSQNQPEFRHFRSPSPTHFPHAPFPGTLIFQGRYMYDSRDPETFRRSIFLADYEGKTVVVKFVERYSREAHENLATVGLAPALHFCSELVGGVTMVVMDLVIARNAHSEFRYHHLPQTVLDDVKRGLERLHNAQLVHGDVRRANILVMKSTSRDGQSSKEEWRGQLIDFDWSGNFATVTRPGVRYPPTLNTGGEIQWARGVEPGGEIRPNHDLEMLDMIIRGIDS